jgi:hypothetical protein
MGARRARAGQDQAFVRQQVDQALSHAGLKAARARATEQTWQQREKSPFGEAGFARDRSGSLSRLAMWARNAASPLARARTAQTEAGAS